MIVDNLGNVYGSASGVYELSPGAGSWTYKSICAVQFCSTYGIANKGSFVFAASRTGGTYGGGSVFELTSGRSGWQARTLYSFGAFPSDGQTPVNSPLVADNKGNIYGATFSGGSNNCGNGGCGTVYKLTRGSNGQYTETILYNFQAPSAETGFNPVGGVILDNAGNLYGTTGYGGAGCGCGVVFQLSPNNNGTWTYTILHNFENSDGDLPAANLTFDSHGNLFGTTVGGGPNGGGVVFEISRQ